MAEAATTLFAHMRSHGLYGDSARLGATVHGKCSLMLADRAGNAVRFGGDERGVYIYHPLGIKLSFGTDSVDMPMLTFWSAAFDVVGEGLVAYLQEYPGRMLRPSYVHPQLLVACVFGGGQYINHELPLLPGIPVATDLRQLVGRMIYPSAKEMQMLVRNYGLSPLELYYLLKKFPEAVPDTDKHAEMIATLELHDGMCATFELLSPK